MPAAAMVYDASQQARSYLAPGPASKIFSLLPTVNGHVSATNGHQTSSPSSAAALSDELSIDGFIRGKTWLITGVTGFLGTVLVDKILREAPDGTRIYVPIRSTTKMSYEERFWTKVLPRDFFNLLRSQKGAAFEDFIRQRLIPIEGDVDKPLLGFSPELLSKLQDEVDVIVHCAANTGFHVPLDEIMITNVGGFMEVVNIAASCKRLQVCSTVSTAYVHGGRIGVLPEVAVHPAEPPSRWFPLVDGASSSSLASGDTVNGDAANGGAANGASPANGHSSETHSGQVSVPGKYLDLDTELEHAKVASAAAREQAAASGLKGRELSKHLRKLLVAVGKDRARQFGWHDSYTYSKALAELAAARAARDHGIPMVLLRPTIVESAMREPAPGIIDSIACMEPLVFAVGRGAMDGFPCDPTLPLDIVPVDVAINGFLAAIAASAGRPGTQVYQVGTSQCNPLVLQTVIDVVFEYFKAHPMQDDITGELVKLDKPMCAYPDVPSFVAALQAHHDTELAEVDLNTKQGRAMQESLARALKFIQYLAEIYWPYTNYQGVFAADNLLGLWERLAPEERETYPFAMHQIDWRDYLRNTHLPGIRRYLLDENEEDWSFDQDSTLTVGRNY